ncbi:N-formylglutamate amidohydrolase [Roseospira visakhapatnamensis]|uniref:N-formylglutamate amidohydrolase n=1 Tax=Roseospira visakhapatnamensis TaxID=390880 RepID=A0A7W6REM1_9PROT|nr:N-formylglutamate amidohydrolase [Roseospira visakhapatnamensis]MBB4267007.1 N-formylglutamate amidohydrolase [Roseospira visakhapatnamensis]
MTDPASDSEPSDPLLTRAAVRLRTPTPQTLPLVVASPHSGTAYPAAFLAVARPPLAKLRASEDTHVEAMMAAAPELGAPLLAALFPRVFLDVNREPWELDPAMFSDPLPACANTTSPRVRAGLGTLPRLAGDGAPIYARRLPLAEAERRLARHYYPYHETLARLVSQTRVRFGHCVLLDCHSMPSSALEEERAWTRPDVILGDRHGTACDPLVTDTVEAVLGDMGLRVRRNRPYAGGHTTRHHGRPDAGIHALQIEVNRALYMDEGTRRPTDGLARLGRSMAVLMEAVGSLPRRSLAAE